MFLTLHTPEEADIAQSRIRIGNREIVDYFPTVARNLRPSQWLRPELEQIQFSIQRYRSCFMWVKAAVLGPLSII